MRVDAEDVLPATETAGDAPPLTTEEAWFGFVPPPFGWGPGISRACHGLVTWWQGKVHGGVDERVEEDGGY